jgi:hypothetical protein
MDNHAKNTSSGAATAGSEDPSASTQTINCPGEIVVSYEQVKTVMELFIMQGHTADEMKRRASLLKLEASTCVAAFDLLDKLGLDPNGSELDKVMP